MIPVSAPGRRRSDYWAGVVIVGLAVLCMLLMARINSDRKDPGDMIEYKVVFDLASGVEGVTPGSLVFYGGIEVGRIEGVSYQDRVLTVRTLIQKKFRLHPGATITRSGSLIGGKASFVIKSTGDNNANALPDGSRIKASSSKGGAGAIVGHRNADRLGRIQEALSRTSDDFGMVESGLAEIRKTRDSVEDFSAEVNTDLKTWEPRMKAIESRVDLISPKLSAAGENLSTMKDSAVSLEGDWLQLQTLFTDERFETLKTDLEQALADFDELASRFEQSILPRAESIADAIETLETHSEASLAELQRLSKEGRRTMQTFVANSTLAAQELVLAKDEIIGSLGLSLLERPSELDMNLMIREEALEAWARTATRLQLLLGAVESLKIDPSDSSRAPETLDRLREELQRTLDAYLDSQKRIFSPTASPAAAAE